MVLQHFSPAHHYPKAGTHQRGIHEPDVKKKRYRFLRSACLNLAILQLLFLGLFAYIFGSLFTQNSHIHNLNVFFVDYDGGSVGAAFRTAYQQQQAANFPTLLEQSAADYPDPAASLRQAVCSARIWGALFISAGATEALNTALQGGTAAAQYNPVDYATLVWNEARYATVVDSAIYSSMNTLTSAARVDWMNSNANATLTAAQSGDPAAIRVLSQPFTLQDIDILPTKQGARLIYNTLVIILVLNQEFFYLGTINGLYAQSTLYSVLRPRRIIAYRLAISAAYCLIGSLCVSGMIWAFRDGWNVNGGQFMLSWMVLWLFAHVNFSFFDFCSIWLKPSFVPLALITWVVINVVSILLPFELNPGFYHWGYALPAHSIYNTLIDIWTAGCNPVLFYSLPVLFSWEVLGLTLSVIGVFRRCHYAVIAEEQQAKSMDAKIREALTQLDEQRTQRKEAEKRKIAKQLPSSGEEADEDTQEEDAEKEDLDQCMSRMKTRPSTRERRTMTAAHFGPAFPLTFGEDDDDDDQPPEKSVSSSTGKPMV